MADAPRLIRGTHDLLPTEYHAHRPVIDRSEAEAKRAGFDRSDTPIMEESVLFNRGPGETSDVAGKGLSAFTTRGGEEVSLRPEGTASVVRAYFSHGLAQSVPLRYFYAGPMFRYERPQKGRLRQFHQFGVELIGGGGWLADLEIIALGSATLQTLGVAQRVKLHLNTLGSREDRVRYREALMGYFRPRRDVLSADSQSRLERNPLRILDSRSPEDRALFDDAPKMVDFLEPDSQRRFARVCAGLDDLGIDYLVDDRLVRGLDYYEHTAFEFVTTELGAQGTVLGGGCYDRLFEIVGGKSAMGVGFAAGVERLAALRDAPAPGRPDCVLVPIGAEAEAVLPVLAQDLRRAGIATVFGFGGKVKARMRQADQLGVSTTILLGAQEMADGVVVVRQMATGVEERVNRGDLVAYLRGGAS